MFIVYVNDLSRRVKNSSIFKFADDLKCYKAIYSIIIDSNLVQSDLNSLYDWSADNLLFFQYQEMCCSYYISSAILMWSLIVPSMELY